MTSNVTPHPPVTDPAAPVALPHRTVTIVRVAALCTFLAFVMGSIVCATESGAACPTWPGCYPDRLAPHFDISPVVEFTHRVVAVATGPVLVLAGLALARAKAAPAYLKSLPWLALGGALASAVFGRIVVLHGLPKAWGCLDLLAALLAMTAMAVAAVRVSEPTDPPHPIVHDANRSEWLAWSALVVVHVTGIVVAGAGSYTRCMGWPVLRLVTGDDPVALQWGRLALTVAAAVLIVGIVRRRVLVPRTRRLALSLAGLVALELILGVVLVGTGVTLAVAAAYSALAGGIVFALGMLAARIVVE